jgi:hypothetical protein
VTWFIDGHSQSDETGRRVYPIQAPPPQRKPETGERLDGEAKPIVPGRCYICGRREASTYLVVDVPQCIVCFERFRRKSG